MKEVFLHNPTFLQLDDSYRSLPLLESIQVKSSNYEQTIHDLEKIGFVAIEIQSYSQVGSDQTIRAYKGKHGPCYFKEKKAGYTGSAVAALDDDNHLLFKNELVEVCDKTFNILGLDPYRTLVNRESNFQEISQKRDLKNDKKSDFESAQVRLHDNLKNKKKRSVQRKILFYPGPFRILIIADGSMVYRGKWCSVPIELSKELIEKDQCIESGHQQEGLTTYFQEEYSVSGSACLLNDFNPETPRRQKVFETDLSKLQTLSKGFRDRLLYVIDKERKYFILIGNDMDDQLGCCPSREVTEANLLVKNGILSSLAEPLQGDSCPVTMYAFKDELSLTPEGLSDSRINRAFRNEVREILSGTLPSTLVKVLKWVLLIFIIFSLGIAVRKCQDLRNTGYYGSVYEQLSVTAEDRFMVILFHNQKRCFQCRQMEKHTIDLLNSLYSNEFVSEGFKFKTVVIDDPGNRNIVDMFGIFAPTLVLLEFEKKEIIKSKVLWDATGLYRKEIAFKDLLETEINQFLEEDDR